MRKQTVVYVGLTSADRVVLSMGFGNEDVAVLFCFYPW